MTSFATKVVIAAPVETVEEAMWRAENAPHWTKHLERMEVVKRTPEMVGSVSRLHYLENGRRYVMEDRMVEAEPGRRYVSIVSGDPIEARVETQLRPVPEGTEMTIRWSGRGKVQPLKLLMPLLRGRMRRQAQEELETFKTLVETKGSDFSA
jgi:uncharacterized membrane protein